MNKTKTWVAIIGAGVVASLGVAIGYFPELKALISSISGVIVAVIGFVNGSNND